MPIYELSEREKREWFCAEYERAAGGESSKHLRSRTSEFRDGYDEGYYRALDWVRSTFNIGV